MTQDADEIDHTTRTKVSVSAAKQRIDDHYHITSKAIGHGVAGSVYPAIHRKTGQIVAVKSIKKANKQWPDQIRREIEYLKEVQHPNLIKAHDVFEDKSAYHIVTDMCRGRELFDVIIEKASSSQGCFQERDAKHIICDLLSAVAYLHSLDIIHRDIKPENIMFVKKDSDKSPIKLIDFGLSIRHRADQQKLTSTVGTAYYIAPQVLKGSYDRSCDLWSIGTIAYLMLCGRPAFDGKTDDEILTNVRKGKYNMDSARWQDVSDDAKDFVQNLLQVNPARRMTAAQALEHAWFAECN